MLKIIFLSLSFIVIVNLINNLFLKIIFKNYIFILTIIIILLINKINNYYKIFYSIGIDSISIRLIILTL